MRRPRPILLLLILLASAPSHGEEGVAVTRPSPAGEAAERPNLVLISVDTLRPDHLGVYGYARPTSPTFDRLAGEGVLFTNAVAPSTWTLPSHATMLTGVTPFRHGAVSKSTPMTKGVIPLAKRLRAQGYATIGIVNGVYLSPNFGFRRGFDRYLPKARSKWRVHHDTVLHVLRNVKRRPVFFFLHYMRVHDPYNPLPRDDRFRRPYTGSVPNALRPIMRAWRAGGMKGPVISDADRDHLVDLYDGSIRSMDALLAEVLEAVDALGSAPTYVILTSDHGEEFLDHQMLGHGPSLYEEALRVPLMIRGPGLPAGRRMDGLVGLVDVVPTVLDLLGLPPAPRLDGRSLRPYWERETDPDPGRALVLRTSFIDGTAVRVGMRTRSGKLVIHRARETTHYFDLDRDPGEMAGRPDAPEVAPLREKIEGLRVVQTGTAVTLSPEEAEQLRALGYMDAPPPAPERSP